MIIKFENGYRTTYTGLYGGNYTVKVIDRTDNTVTLRSFWIAEDTWEGCHADTTYDIEIDTIGEVDVERIVIWEYVNHKYNAHDYGYLYAADSDVMDYIYEYGQMPTEEDLFGPFDKEASYTDPYEDAFIRSSTRGDYGPSDPWNAPGMSVHDFI